jgi:hypothetical protein
MFTEIFVYRKLAMVQVYQVLSHGRRFYRVLEYTSNAKLCMRDMQPSVDDRGQPWPIWERHGAGHPYANHWKAELSCVITRGSDYAQNLSGGIETLVPARLLYGVLPQALLDSYTFWQDESDDLRGYPRDEHCPYVVEVHLSQQQSVACSLLQGVCGTVRRVLKARRAAETAAACSLALHLGASVGCSSATGPQTHSDPATAEAQRQANSWKFGFTMMQRMRRIVQRVAGGENEERIGALNLDDVKEFVDALRISGATYGYADELVSAVEKFVEDSCGGLVAGVAPSSVQQSNRNSGGQLLDQAELTLINVAFARSDSKFFGLLQTVSRLENASYILCWTTERDANAPVSIDLLEMPRLKLSFHEQLDADGVSRLYSMDHVNLFVSNKRSSLTAQLMAGMPHALLMSTHSDELQILVPAVDPARPRIGSSPFSTELVINRSANADWNAAMESTAFLYPVHVSLSFLFSPTLSSSLYLLVLRYLHRSYEDVFRLASTIGTDVEFSEEENAIFQCIGRAPHKDAHPDAHACLLKIALVVLDSPVNLPFDLTAQMSRYVSKLGHVNSICRLSLPDELFLLEQCVSEASDPRFIDPLTMQPRYTLLEITVVKNRKFYLRALLGGESVTEVFTVPRTQGTRWLLEKNLSAVMLDPSSYLDIAVTYSAPTELSAHATLDVVGRVWAGQEDMAGHALSLGFLFLYELLTGTKSAKFLTTDCSASVAVLLFELYSDKTESSFLSSILSLMCRYPQLRDQMPRFRDTRQMKRTTIRAAADDLDPISPLGTLISACLGVLEAEMADLLIDAPEYDTHPLQPPSNARVLAAPFEALQIQTQLSFPEKREDHDTGSATGTVLVGRRRAESWLLPCVSNYSCGYRSLQPISIPTRFSGNNSLTDSEDLLVVSDEALRVFATLPLAGLNLDAHVTHKSRGTLVYVVVLR